jgi:hypothetical protein
MGKFTDDAPLRAENSVQPLGDVSARRTSDQPVPAGIERCTDPDGDRPHRRSSRNRRSTCYSRWCIKIRSTEVSAGRRGRGGRPALVRRTLRYL